MNAEPYPAAIQAIQRGRYGLAGFRRFAKLLGLRIHPFQAVILGFYFAGVTELVVLISKKNGKTTLLAALALYHLLMTPRAECVIGASSRDQATVLFDQAKTLIRDAGLERVMLPRRHGEVGTYTGVFEILRGYRVIRFEGGRVRVLAADADTADGVIPTLAIVDELHRHPSGALYGVFRDGLLGNAQMITISTAGATMASPLGRLLESARSFADVARVRRRTTYRSPDGSFVLIEWALREGDDPDDLRAVKDVNPAPWHTIASLRRRHDSPSTSRGQWLRFACGVWTEGDEPAIDGSAWDALGADIGPIREGEEIVLVPSVGHVAALGMALVRDGGIVAVRADVLEPREGRSLLADTEDAIVAACSRWTVRGVYHPLGSFMRSADLLAGRGIPMIQAPQSPAALAAASATFDRLRRSGELVHDGDPILRRHVLAGQIHTTEQGERYRITDQARALIAVVMAAHYATAVEPTPTVVLPSVG